MTFKRAEVENLLRLSDQYDEEGKTEEAQALHLAALKIVEAAEKEKKEEKAGRAMSGKAKSKFRAVQKACQSLCDADLDVRGQYKKQCRKVETLCEEILETLEECDFG